MSVEKAKISSLKLDVKQKFQRQCEKVWLLNLDQIEQHSGKVISKEYVSISEIGNSTHYFSKGTVLYSKLRPYLNKVVIADEDGFATTELVPINCDVKKVDPEYLAYFLRSEIFLTFATNVVAGAKMPRMVMGEFWNYEIPLPPLAEQRRIASILDQADELRQKRQQAIEKLDQLLQATFIDMFGDPVSNPKGWQIEPLKNNILHANNGLSRRRKELENVGDIVLRLQDVHYDGIHFDKELNRISLDDSEKKRFSVDEGDILFIRVNGNPEYVGRSAVFSGYKEPIFHNDHLIRIKLSERYIPNFLSYCFNTPQGKNIISKQIKTSAGQHTVSQGGIEIMKFYIPPIKLQEQWTNLYLKIEDQKKKLNEQLDIQNQLFSSLQNQAFNGTL